MQQDQWHYKDERNGTRCGPVDRDAITKLIAGARIERSTLVWNPAMPEWEKAGTTDLSSLFGDTPPPLPANEIGRWAIYALALFPLWGLAIEALICAAFSDRVGLSAREMFDHYAWILFFIVGNGILGDLDERQLKKGGLKLRSAAIIAGILTPYYIFASCRTVNRHAGRRWSFYFPVLLWVLAVAGSAALDGLMFDPDAPLVLRPDAWF